MNAGFQQTQQQFTDYIRDPDRHSAPVGIKPERIAMYRELIFNNIDSFLANNFPVLNKIVNSDQWYALIQDFFVNHSCRTPYFSEIAEEFIEFLSNERNDPQDFPFLLELAHYEWVEMALSIAVVDEQVAIISIENPSDLINAKVKLSVLAWPLVYQFPVQKISPEYLPMSPPKQPTFLLAYRDDNEDVKFNEINAMTYRLLEIFQDNESIKDVLDRVVSETQLLDSENIIKGGLQIIVDLLNKGVLRLT
jgi:hypothetical protein